MAKNIDIETIKMVKELLGATGNANTPPGDRDSFASFIGGLRENWVFVLAMMGAFFWLNTHINSNIQTNSQQDTHIQSLIETVQQLTENMGVLNEKVDTVTSGQNVVNNEIIRRLDALQTTVEFIKANK